MKRCKVCRKKPKLERRVDSAGNLFCSDDCFEEFEVGPDDFSHPYIDDYEAIRRFYEEWMMNTKRICTKAFISDIRSAGN